MVCLALSGCRVGGWADYWGHYSLYVGPVEGLIRTGDGDRLVMAYLWMTLSGEELGMYEGYYGVFRDYG
jgi:hypothetical protein